MQEKGVEARRRVCYFSYINASTRPAVTCRLGAFANQRRKTVNPQREGDIVRVRPGLLPIGVGLLVLSIGCHSIARSSRSGIELEIQSPDTVRRGDPVRARLVASNTSSHTIELDLVGSPEQDVE
jgi:hypothetical protein